MHSIQCTMSRQNGSNSLTRRKSLSYAATLATVGIAGCLGGGGDEPDYDVDKDAPARLAVISLEFDEDITYTDTFSGEITIANTGGETIEENAEISLQSPSGEAGSQSAEINSSELESGDSLSHTLGEFEAVESGEFAVSFGNQFAEVFDEVPESVDVSPIELGTNEEIETPSGVRVTVDDASYEQALLNRSEGGRSSDFVVTTRETLDEQVICLAQVTVGNGTGERITVGGNNSIALSIIGGNSVSGLNLADIDQPEVRNAGINPGESVTGWIAATVDTADAEDLQLGMHTVSTNGDHDVVIDIPGTQEFPKFELVDSTTPSQRQPGDEQFSFEIENTGAATGTFRGSVEFRFDEDQGIFSSYEEGVYYSWDRYFSQEIPAGETRTVSFSSSSDSSVTYRISPFGGEYSIEA